MQITVNMIETKEFKTKPRGYDPQEVDEFLDAICDEMIRLQEQLATLEQDLEAAKAARKQAEAAKQVRPAMAPAPVTPAAPVTVPADDIREILEMAQKVKNETISAAKAHADEILAKAQADAAAKLGSLEADKEKLTNQVEALKNAAGEYRTKFEALLQAQQEALEKASDLF